MSETPHRQWRLRLDLEADDYDDLWRTLDRISLSLEQSGAMPHERTSGSPSEGWHLTITADPEMNADRYKAALSQYITEKRSNA